MFSELKINNKIYQFYSYKDDCCIKDSYKI